MKREASPERRPPEPRRLVPGVHTVIPGPTAGSQNARTGSWWLSLDRATFTARAQQEEARLRRGPISGSHPPQTR